MIEVVHHDVPRTASRPLAPLRVVIVIGISLLPIAPISVRAYAWGLSVDSRIPLRFSKSARRRSPAMCAMPQFEHLLDLGGLSVSSSILEERPDKPCTARNFDDNAVDEAPNSPHVLP